MDAFIWLKDGWIVEKDKMKYMLIYFQLFFFFFYLQYVAELTHIQSTVNDTNSFQASVFIDTVLCTYPL